MQVARLASRVQLDIQHLLRDGTTLATPACDWRPAGRAPDRTARVEPCLNHVVHQHRATTQEVTVAFERQVERRFQQRMARADKGRQGLALRRDEGFSKAMRS